MLYSRLPTGGNGDAADFFNRAADEKLGQAGVWLNEMGMIETLANLNFAIDGETVNQEALEKPPPTPQTRALTIFPINLF